VRRCGPENDRWQEVSEVVAREKVGYVFRDILSHRYRSSSASKAAHRRFVLKQHSKGDKYVPLKQQHEKRSLSQERWQYLPKEESCFEKSVYYTPDESRMLPSASFLVNFFENSLDEIEDQGRPHQYQARQGRVENTPTCGLKREDSHSSSFEERSSSLSLEDILRLTNELHAL
jgi:hypothetical protein